MIFFFEVQHLQNRWSNFDIFLQTDINLIQISYLKKGARKTSNFWKKSEIFSFDIFLFLGRQLGFRFLFGKFEFFLDHPFLIRKGHKIVNSLQKTSWKSAQLFWRCCTSKQKYHFNFTTCGFGNLIFDPWGHKMGANYCFYVLFLFSNMKQRVWYITRDIYPASLENLILLPHFALLPVFTKSTTVQKPEVVEKTVCDFQL